MISSQRLGSMASAALIAEASLTPKPALVDERGAGAHKDLTLEAMLKSASAIEPFFQEMAGLSAAQPITSSLRANLAECGRRAETAMYEATGGSNAHRGAIWCLGLLVASAAAHAVKQPQGQRHIKQIAGYAAQIAALPDRNATALKSHGQIIKRTYGVGGARSEAQSGFPHVVAIGLPHLKSRREAGATETVCQLDALMAIMSSLDDTCLLYRGGRNALDTAKSGAKQVIALGGTSNPQGMARLFKLDRDLLELGASPGGSADLLAATLFLDALAIESFESHIASSPYAEITDRTLIGRSN